LIEKERTKKKKGGGDKQRQKMATAESLVAQIQGLSSNAVDLGLLSIHLKKADEVLHNESTRLLAFLEQLDPTLHSLGYLYFL
jgi:COP9 signalosome complex subunit 3